MSNVTLARVQGGNLVIEATTITSLTAGINDQSVYAHTTANNGHFVVGTLASVKATVVAGGPTGTDVLSPYFDSKVTLA